MLLSRLSFLLIILAGFSSCKGSNNPEPDNPAGKQLRVLGYYHSGSNWTINEIAPQLNKLTDLNLAFINPDASGRFADYPTLAAFVKEVQQRKVRVFFSFGGGSAPEHLATLVQPANRTTFIENIKSFLVTYNFDGVDVDLENELINADYGPFVKELASAVKGTNKLISAAVARWNADQINDETLAHYDFLNIMSYDKTGPWNLDRPGQHSPYSMAESDFIYFRDTRQIPSQKLLIGLPFYGYGFGTNAPSSMTYGNIVNTYPGAELKDELTIEGGGMLYYNGIPTIRQKTAFALKQKAGGVMIWQIRGDASDSRSLLNTIHEEKTK
ncbi:glycosyl hydrolase family 18 protein [Flavihumibacter sp. UBA7668]|uniref:glycosyl hydrolase family 18 protein n=1 Tax=Flavihumibacter sp. UBA7668 TaxID=1946542 RepID=UPI0025BFE521|nr:glycosyl hydrolase family 18 protein [Flavihumibacter sp. UBA7668]